MTVLRLLPVFLLVLGHLTPGAGAVAQAKPTLMSVLTGHVGDQAGPVPVIDVGEQPEPIPVMDAQEQAQPVSRTAVEGNSGPVAAARGSGGPSPEPFVLPLPGASVLTPFRAPAQRYGAGHRGVDLGGTSGVPVLAAGGGVVAFAGRVAGRPVVSVLHPSGLRTTYEPVVATVPVGASIRSGAPIGTLADGHPGCPVAACLHWGARLPDDSYLDPMTLLAPRRVRLLPWVDP